MHLDLKLGLANFTDWNTTFVFFTQAHLLSQSGFMVLSLLITTGTIAITVGHLQLYHWVFHHMWVGPRYVHWG